MKWIERIKDTSVPLSRYEPSARDWNSCAVNECREMFPGLVRVTIEESIPTDPRVKRLGLDFWRAVKNDNRDRAMRLYFQIHARLLRMMRDAAEPPK